MSSSQTVPFFSIGTGPSEHSFVSNGVNIFDITDGQNNPIVNQIVVPGFVSSIDARGNQYGSGGGAFGAVYLKIESPLLEQNIVSTHYNQNP